MSTTLTDRIQRLDCESIRTDTLQVGPRGTVLGSGWQSFTPVFSVGAPNAASVNVGRFQVVGRTCTVKFVFEQAAAGTAGSGNYTIALPAGIRAVANAVSSEVVGAARLRVATAQHLGVVNIDSTGSNLSIFVGSDTVAPSLWSSSLGALSGNDLAASFTATFEIAN